MAVNHMHGPCITQPTWRAVQGLQPMQHAALGCSEVGQPCPRATRSLLWQFWTRCLEWMSLTDTACIVYSASRIPIDAAFAACLGAGSGCADGYVGEDLPVSVWLTILRLVGESVPHILLAVEINVF